VNNLSIIRNCATKSAAFSDKMGKPLVIPEEIVHYSEWVYAMRDRFKERQLVDMSMITATVHPACHYYKIVAEDAIYDPEIYGGQRTAVVTALLENSASTLRITPPGSIAVDLVSVMCLFSATSPVRSRYFARSKR
jgi:hypothetical protein